MNFSAQMNTIDELKVLKGSRAIANSVMSALESGYQDALRTAQGKIFSTRDLTFEQFLTAGPHWLDLENIGRQAELDVAEFLRAIVGARPLIDPMVMSQHGINLRSELGDATADTGGAANWTISFRAPAVSSPRLLRLRR